MLALVITTRLLVFLSPQDPSTDVSHMWVVQEIAMQNLSEASPTLEESPVSCWGISSSLSRINLTVAWRATQAHPDHPTELRCAGPLVNSSLCGLQAQGSHKD